MSCNHEVTIPTRRVIANGTTIVSLQCQKCGTGRAAKMSEYKVSELPEFDITIHKAYLEQQTKEWLEKREQQVHEYQTKSGEWWGKYSAYLLSDHWRQLRRRVIARDIVCQVCFHLSASQAHHLTYESFNKYGVSFSVECVGVCESCHDLLHGKERQ